ncbi:MAG: hypothetical protein CMF96_06450 [Candidatus Marinimicrobia bacterium]|nr:hypothetical protein [Candidatus Neomarinimicrobiota bacterium]|tara:strand:- start:4686 stop:5024 length:339 start_codon:yes stop_codon:yes gene_type:complete
MRLIKSLIGIFIVVGSVFFLFQNHVINPNDMTIWIYYGKEINLKLTEIIALFFLLGAIIGILLSAIQIISHKAEIMSLKSTKRKLQVELDTLRNQAISDDVEIKDASDNIEL